MPNPRTILPDARTTPRFAGLTTFCRFPRLQDVPPEHRPVDWALYGAPFDAGVTYRPGARFGPRAVREASQYAKPYHLELGVNICETWSLADAGDAPVLPFDLEANVRSIAGFAGGLGEPSRTKLLAVGGDHSIAYANIRATWERRGRPVGGLPLIHLDSHLDTVDAVWGSRWSHASVFIRAIEDGLVDPRRMISVGVKGPLNRAEDLDLARSRGVTLVPFNRWRTDGPATLAGFLAGLAGAEAYLTFDVDVVDPAFAPGTGTPSVGGFTSVEILSLLRSMQGVRLAGADVVEVLPDRDPAGITSMLAAQVIVEVLALDALARA
jgi:agmatinase